MSKVIALLGAAACLAAALPQTAAAADFYDGGDRPFAFHSRDDVVVDGGRARFERREDVGPAYRDRRGPGPVVFDERGPDRFDGRPPFDAPRFGSPPPIGYVYGRPAAFAPPVERFHGAEIDFRPVPAYRVAAVPGFGDPRGWPDGRCTVERAQSLTPDGWRRIVTHRTCYRR